MADKSKNISLQLRETCKLTGARWAAWLNRTESGWSYGARHGLSKPRQAELDALLQEPKTAAWLAGTFGSGRVRSRQTGRASIDVGCRRLYVFPNLEGRSALLVGADELNKIGEAFFRVLSAYVPGGDFYALELEDADYELEASYNPEGVLQNVLEFLAGQVDCESALMSIRSGDIFRVEAVWNYPDHLRGQDVSLHDNPSLAEMVATRHGSIGGGEPRSDPSAASWIGAPIVIGKRVIGHLEFVSSRQNNFNKDDLARIMTHSGRLAYVVENAIIFAEAARYLQQLALLNELASAASLGVDTNEVARRVMQRLRRTFRTNQVGVFLLSLDGKSLREYGYEAEHLAPVPIPVASSLEGYVVQSGAPVRRGDLRGGENILPEHRPSQAEPPVISALAVPLKYRGRVIGALSLQSSELAAFTLQDEQLLVLIASHLAGLFENMRLNEETRERARNLSLIHQVVRRVVGLTDLAEIARVSAELMVQRFDYQLASLILLNGESHSLVVSYPGSASSLAVSEGNDVLARLGIVQKVLSDGSSRIVNDASQEPGFAPRQDLAAGSEMCVPLREGEHILGAIDVQRERKDAFTENDLMALEALAGVLSSVVLSARRYQQLQESVRQLQAVRETALDIAGDLDLDSMLKRVAHRARELVGARGVELGLIDEGAQVVRLVVSETPWSYSKENTIPLMAGVAGRVAAFGEPLVVRDYNSWNGRLYPERQAPFHTVAGVPLKFKGEVIGTLMVIDDRTDWVFGPEHIKLLEMLAPQVTVWIRNARLYQELQERIEAQRMAENRLIRSARLAAVGEMAAGVAHELNNPLTTVTGFVELVLEELPPDSPHRPDLELVLRESQRARGVVRRLLDFSRPPENRKVRTDMNELINDTLSLVRHLLRVGGVDLRLNLAEGLPWASVDPAQMKQVLLNLVHNAIQAMPDGGKLKIRTGRARHEGRDWLTVCIRDSGEGISSDNLQRIFEPFFSTRPAGSGTGLGLSVSYGIITEHGGFIEVDSKVGQGSCFTIYLPLENETNDA